MSTTQSAARPTAPERHETRKAVFAAAIGNVLEWYDFGVYVLFAATIGHTFFPNKDHTRVCCSHPLAFLASAF
jgi:MHS family proline/betaine transporter-like MFS transporter